MDQPKTKLLVLSIDTKEFTANGTKYLVEQTISPQRYEMWNKMAPELAYGITVPELFKMNKEIFDAVNKGGRTADIAVISHNIMRGLAECNENKRPVFWKMCALYINTPQEDRITITEDVINRKVDDWYAEGVDTHSFFTMALASIAGFREAYEQAILDISRSQSQKKDKRNSN